MSVPHRGCSIRRKQTSMHHYAQQTSFCKRKVWMFCLWFVCGDHRWMRLRQSNTWKSDRDNWCQSRRPVHPLLAEPTVTCSSAKVRNWLPVATGKAAIPLWCFYVFTQLSNYYCYFTCILRLWLPLFTKIQTPNYMPPGHAQWYPVIDTEWSLSILLSLSEYYPADFSHPQTSVCLIIGIAYAYLEMLLNPVLLNIHSFLL